MIDERQPLSASGLAERLNLLLDAYQIEHGQTMTFVFLAEQVRQYGSLLKDSRWKYMITGNDRRVTDEELLRAISQAFGLPKDCDYLTDERANTPEMVWTKLTLITSMRAAKVSNLAMRSLGPLAPEAIAALTELLDSIAVETPMDVYRGSEGDTANE